MSGKKLFTFERFIYIALYAASALAWAYLWIFGGEYYQLPLDERPFHDLHPLMKPGGRIGHGLGFLGMFMMIAMHVYTLRKRFRWFEWMGTLSANLNLHIYLGIAGPFFVILHTAFKFKGLVAISFWSMIIVMLSGFLGRYFYGAIPRRLSGLAYNLNEAKELLETMVFALKNTGGGDSEDIKKLKRQKQKLERKIAIWRILQNRLHYWHLFHKPFSIIMYVILAVHVSVSWFFGYHWLF